MNGITNKDLEMVTSAASKVVDTTTGLVQWLPENVKNLRPAPEEELLAGKCPALKAYNKGVSNMRGLVLPKHSNRIIGYSTILGATVGIGFAHYLLPRELSKEMFFGGLGGFFGCIIGLQINSERDLKRQEKNNNWLAHEVCYDDNHLATGFKQLGSATKTANGELEAFCSSETILLRDQARVNEVIKATRKALTTNNGICSEYAERQSGLLDLYHNLEQEIGRVGGREAIGISLGLADETLATRIERGGEHDR
ncbi:MAG: hypothetical protein AABX70_06535 [Nanoarchaeota archaeon]|mgnify:CR=1 FL=1